MHRIPGVWWPGGSRITKELHLQSDPNLEPRWRDPWQLPCVTDGGGPESKMEEPQQISAPNNLLRKIFNQILQYLGTAVRFGQRWRRLFMWYAWSQSEYECLHVRLQELGRWCNYEAAKFLHSEHTGERHLVLSNIQRQRVQNGSRKRKGNHRKNCPFQGIWNSKFLHPRGYILWFRAFLKTPNDVDKTNNVGRKWSD